MGICGSMPDNKETLDIQAETLWSTWIQSVEMLEYTRENLRFCDSAQQVIMAALGVGAKARVAEIGCGGGALSRALARWLGPGCNICGIDRDTNFLAHAKRRASEEHLHRRLHYLQGDALALPLPDSSVDATISYTVVEHIPDTVKFLQEQLRICKPGGKVVVLETCPGGVTSVLTALPETTAREQKLWRRLNEAFEKHVEEPWQVGRKRRFTTLDLLNTFKKVGLINPEIMPFASVTTPSILPEWRQQVKRYLDNFETWLVCQAAQSATLMTDRLPAGYIDELQQLIRERFAKQRAWIDSDEARWEVDVCLGIAVAGVADK
jgi:ubiquinone/menaquinone biosynthesis C-methylase UbiE